MKDLSSLASQRRVIGGVQIAPALVLVLLLLLHLSLRPAAVRGASFGPAVAAAASIAAEVKVLSLA